DYARFFLHWLDVAGTNRIAMLWTLVLSMSSAMIGACLVRDADRQQTRRILWCLTIGLAAASAIYFAESFFSLGLRSAEDTQWTDFGIQRVKGPLYGSSTGQFILYPALGCSI